MKIDFISTGYYPIIGGTETVVKNLAERMALKGHNVTVHASTYNPNYNEYVNFSLIFSVYGTLVQ